MTIPRIRGVGLLSLTALIAALLISLTGAARVAAQDATPSP
jgi:hypothetical protein